MGFSSMAKSCWVQYKNYMYGDRYINDACVGGGQCLVGLQGMCPPTDWL